MQLALECPTFLLRDIQPLADFDWILTHLVLQDSEYADFYRNSKRQKILDNSVNELLEPCTFEDIEKAANIVNPDLIVPPDYLGDRVATETALDEALGRFGWDMLLPCIQGENPEYVMEYLDYIIRLDFTRVAVPYDILSSRQDSVTTMATNRQLVVNKIISRVPIGFGIHLLGMTTLEELKLCNKDWVKSIDTGVPVLYGMNHLYLNEPWKAFKKDKPTLSQMQEPEDFIRGGLGLSGDKLSRIFWNIAYLRRIIS